LLFFCLLSVTYHADAQISSALEVQAERACQELDDKGIAKDEVKQALQKKGIDLDNLKPEQLVTLEDDIQLVVSDFEDEKNDTPGAFIDATTTLTKGLDNLLEKQLEENVVDNTEDTSEAMKQGGSLKEALSSDVSERL